MRYLILVSSALLLAVPAVWGDEGTPSSAFDNARQQAQIQSQRTTAKVHESLASAEKAMAAERFPDADLSLQEAMRLLRDAVSMPQEDLASLALEVKHVRDLYRQRLDDYLRVREEKADKEIAERERQRQQAEQQFVARQLESHWARLRQFRDTRDYDQALAEARAILENNPNDERAQKELLQLEFLKGLAEEVAIRVDRRIETRSVLTDVEASAVPYNDLYRYPSPAVWKALTEKRLRSLAREMGYTTEELAPPAKLYKRIDIKMTQAPLSSAVAYLSEASGIPIIADPHLKDDTQTSLDEVTVTHVGQQMTVGSILDLILPPSMGWRYADNSIIISSREKANPLKMRIYPIQHLVAEIPDFGSTVPRMNLQDALQQGGQQGGQGAVGFQPLVPEPEQTKPEQKIIDLITRMVKSGDGRIAAWEANGGQASIEYFNGSLIVNQTDEGHRQVALLLARL